MRWPEKVSSLTASVIATVLVCAPIAGFTIRDNRTQTPTVVAVSSNVSDRSASLEFSLSNGDVLRLVLSGGTVSLNGTEIATYDRGGALESAWRSLLQQASELDPSEMLHLLREWNVDELGTDAATTLATMVTPFRAVSAEPVAVSSEAPLVPSTEERGLVSIDLSGLDALEALEGLESFDATEVLEALSSLDVDALKAEIRQQVEAARVAGAESVRENRHFEGVNTDQPAVTSRVAGDVAELLATFVAMCCLGIGLIFFAPRQLEVVADTVRNSFWRSFFVGLLAQPLVLPLFGLLMLGLTITVVGILIIPFAALVFTVALTLAVLGGYLAVARSVGEAYLRRRMSQGYAVGGGLPYRYMLYGLMGLLAIWIPTVLLGWIPTAGSILVVSAVLFTWIIATAGFGATILSRAGIRATFTRRFDLALSDEYLYRTPQATPIVSTRPRQPRSDS